MTIINNPFNYVGSKDRMLNIVLDNLDTSKYTFIDAFCGGGVVGANVLDLYKEVIMNDGCWQLIGMLNAIQNDSDFIKNVDAIIDAFGLSKDNKEGFLECRETYNSKFCKENTFNPYMLYALVTHAFSYNMVFNKSGGFSVPSGKGRSWFNPNLRSKLTLFQHVLQENPVPFYSIKMAQLFDLLLETRDKEYLKDTMIYLDPPYSACCADGSVSRSYGLKWTASDDEVMFRYLDKFNELGVHWLLSNVFENKGVENTNLKKWAEKYNVIEVPSISYGNAHYQAKPSKTVEVLIRNY